MGPDRPFQAGRSRTANTASSTRLASPISLGGNLTFQMRMTDNGEPGEADTIGFSLWKKNGELLHSRNWQSVRTE